MGEVKREESVLGNSGKKIKISIYYLIAYSFIFYGYFFFIVPIYGYEGWKWSPDKSKIVEGIFVAGFLPYILPIQFKKPSDVLLHLQMLFPIIPMLVLYGAVGYSRQYFLVTIISFLLMVLIANKVRFNAIRVTRISPVLFQRMLLALAVMGVASIVIFGGLRFFNLNFLKVYEFRLDAASNLPGIYGYINPLMSKVILPFSLVLAVLNKDRLLAIVSVLGSLAMLGFTGHKGPVIYPFVVLALYHILNKRNIIPYLLLGYIAVILIAIIDFYTGILGYWWGSLTLRRAYLTPAELNFAYYDFFSRNLFTLWSESKITFGLISYQYDVPSSILVGREVYGVDTLNANTGWIGSGYSNGGFIGMLLYSGIIGLLFSYLNAYRHAIDKRVLAALMVPSIMTVMMSSDLPTAFLNHGVLFALLLFSLFSTTKKIGLDRNRILRKIA